MNYDYTVIGGGVSGMTSALILAKQGLSVALVEQSGQLAPTIRGFTKKGLFFDTGFHYTGGLGAGEPVDLFFRYLGLSDALEKVAFREDAFDSFRCLEPPFVFRFPCGYDRIRERFYEVFPDECEAIDTYLSAVREQYHSVPYVNLDMSEVSAGFSTVHGPTLQEFLDRLTNNRLLKCIFSMHCFLYGVAPDEVSFANHANVAGSYYESVNGISGGGLKLTEIFEEQLEKAGVHVFRGQEVTGMLLSNDGAFCGLTLKDGTNVSAEGCISTIHPHRLLEIVPDSVFRPAYVSRLNELEETASACILYAVCSGPIEDLVGSNIFIFPEPDFTCFYKNAAVEKRPMYITAAGGKHDGEKAKHGFIAICPMSKEQTKPLVDPVSQERSANYKLLKEEMSEKMVRSIKASCPEIAEKIIDITCATPLTLRDYTNSPFGSLYGVKHKIGQYNPMPVTRLKGLFLAGQATTAPGIMGAMMSGFLACGTILGHEKLQKELKQCRPEG
ncbi:MAG: NAD(P)/FAD-dependent oxidoreductase [Syntrophus sp. (in: bacteria)]|nr:NAD(P)/FAD-dependent oxidoreductase [Syntrophus sp. (in: bacteria)]